MTDIKKGDYDSKFATSLSPLEWIRISPMHVAQLVATKNIIEKIEIRTSNFLVLHVYYLWT
jgi:hypothetical protein